MKNGFSFLFEINSLINLKRFLLLFFQGKYSKGFVDDSIYILNLDFISQKC